jgi:hypothetical protein
MAEAMELFGIYRGHVRNSIDPERKGRLEVFIPALEQISCWAEPCLSVADARAVAAGVFVPPQRDSMVWIMFVGGDPEAAVWIGCEWPSAWMRKFWNDERTVAAFGEYRE